MLNKCKCGWDAKRFVVGPDHKVFCFNPDCGSGVHESTYEMAELKWNEQNPAPANPPEDFEKMFFRSLIWMNLASINDPNQFLAEFETHFGFDLKEVVREQWAKENRNYD